ncbi:hypothetical protein [Altericista sp. CCNU0014]|uniref:hypothetical protein n=1 Tax=Altericista sp. CCNU0014 TaxID=3082949 RepID=UPI00384DCB3B
MLWHTYPDGLDTLTLQGAYQTLEGDPPSKIPFIVWLLENPESPLALPGCIDLYGHDCLHLLLKQGFTSENEAYVVGFTMGNDIRTNRVHLFIFKLAARVLYPEKYRLKASDIETFERGFQMGKRVQVKNLNQSSFERWEYKILKDIRTEIGLETAI